MRLIHWILAKLDVPVKDAPSVKYRGHLEKV